MSSGQVNPHFLVLSAELLSAEKCGLSLQLFRLGELSIRMITSPNLLHESSRQICTIAGFLHFANSSNPVDSSLPIRSRDSTMILYIYDLIIKKLLKILYVRMN